MRQFFQEGDLVSAEVHNIQNDGTLVLHTRSLRYGKLENGCLVVVPPVLVERRKHHFVDILGMTVLWGTNGYLWIQRSLPEETTTLPEVQERLRIQHATTPVLSEERRSIARLQNSMICLRLVHAMVTPESVKRVFQASLNFKVADMLRPDVVLQLTAFSRSTT
jgi:exosome complex component RRP4